MAEMDIGQSIFEYGQTYVALSRIKSLDGLYLSAFHSEKIAANPKVIAFYNTIPNLDVNRLESGHELKSEKYEEITHKPSNTTKIIKL
jgi:ATP-dependent exoDNAse (exonuclease V) alpha subunit